MLNSIIENIDSLILKLRQKLVAEIKLLPVDDSINILQTIKRLQNARCIFERILVDEGVIKWCLNQEIEEAVHQIPYDRNNHKLS
jgi:hypothetical protein